MGLDMYLKRRVAELEEKNADLEARLGHEQVVTMQNREAQLQGYIRDLEAQVAALQEIAIEQKAAHITFFGFHRNMNEDETKNKAQEEAIRQLAKEHPEAFR